MTADQGAAMLHSLIHLSSCAWVVRLPFKAGGAVSLLLPGFQ